MAVQTFVFTRRKLSRKESGDILETISLAERMKFFKYKNKRDAEFFLWRRYVLRKKLAELMDVAPKEVTFKANGYGKPETRQTDGKKLNFNLSSSGDVAVLAVSTLGEVGIDVERVEKIDVSVIADCLSKDELKYVFENKKSEIDRFYEIWTLKEAFIKALGKGLSLPLQKISFHLRSDKIKVSVRNRKIEGWHFSNYAFGNYKIAVCANGQKKICIYKYE